MTLNGKAAIVGAYEHPTRNAEKLSVLRLHADVAIMGAGGITSDGISNSHVLLIEIQRAMMRAAQTVVFCMDHTKFGRKSMVHLCGFERVRAVVADTNAPADLVQELRSKGLDVLQAPLPLQA